MKKNVKSLLILSIMLLFIIVVGVINWSKNNDHFILHFIGLLFFLIIIGYAFGKLFRDFKKLIETLPADHKLITNHIAVIDIGNFRFIYSIYGKGNTNKTYLSMQVGIPFPSDNNSQNNIKESIKSELQDIINDLQKDGILSSYNSIVRDSAGENNSNLAWRGQPFALEFPLKKVTPSLLNELQQRILVIIEKYQLQDVSWFTCNFLSEGKEYRYHKGNMFQGSVFVFHDFDKKRWKYQQPYTLWSYEIDDTTNYDEYLELFKSASDVKLVEKLSINDINKATKELIHAKKDCVIRITNHSDSTFVVNVSFPKDRTSVTYNLVFSDGLWWIFTLGGDNETERLSPISLDNEELACNLFIMILRKWGE